MIKVSNVKTAGTAIQAAKEPASVAQDSASKEIQGKITAAQKRRQEVFSDAEMTAEEKADRRQKIQQEIADLKRELRQRQLEEQKKQQEEEKAAKAKKEQKENASVEAAKEQQKAQAAQDTGEQRPDSGTDRQNGRNADGSKAGEGVRKAPSGMIQESLSARTAADQVSTLAKAQAKADRTASIREAERAQDAVRGADASKLQKEQKAELEKEARRMARIQAVMLGQSDKAANSDAGVVKQTSGGTRGKGLYNNGGAMFKTNFQSVQMDLKQ